MSRQLVYASGEIHLSSSMTSRQTIICLLLTYLDASPQVTAMEQSPETMAGHVIKTFFLRSELGVRTAGRDGEVSTSTLASHLTFHCVSFNYTQSHEIANHQTPPRAQSSIPPPTCLSKGLLPATVIVRSA